MRAVAAVRKALKVRTAFNILGPLLNPASTKYSLIGVYSPALSPLMGATLQKLGIRKALIVHSHGLDELTPMGDAHVVEVTPSTTTSYRSVVLRFGGPVCVLLLRFACHGLPCSAFLVVPSSAVVRSCLFGCCRPGSLLLGAQRISVCIQLWSAAFPL